MYILPIGVGVGLICMMVWVQVLGGRIGLGGDQGIITAGKERLGKERLVKERAAF